MAKILEEGKICFQFSFLIVVVAGNKWTWLQNYSCFFFIFCNYSINFDFSQNDWFDGHCKIGTHFSLSSIKWSQCTLSQDHDDHFVADHQNKVVSKQNVLPFLLDSYKILIKIKLQVEEKSRHFQLKLQPHRPQPVWSPFFFTFSALSKS